MLPKYKQDFRQPLISVLVSDPNSLVDDQCQSWELKRLNLGNLLTKPHTLILLRDFFFFKETSLIRIGCKKTWAIGLQLSVFPVQQRGKDKLQNYLNNLRRLASLVVSVSQLHI